MVSCDFDGLRFDSGFCLLVLKFGISGIFGMFSGLPEFCKFCVETEGFGIGIRQFL